MRLEDPADSRPGAGVGELRVVDQAFGRQPAVLVRGNESAALGLLTDHFPNLWETGKQYLSVEEIRFDVHRFFSLRSSAGQASVALYRLSKWAAEVKDAHDVEAKVFVDVAEPGLKDQVRAALGRDARISKIGSLHAGTQCCEKLPALHYREPGYQYHQGAPAFAEDIVIPWEGTRLINSVKKARFKPDVPVKLVARVSEGPEVRVKLKKQIEGMLPKSSQVIVLYRL